MKVKKREYNIASVVFISNVSTKIFVFDESFQNHNIPPLTSLIFATIYENLFLRNINVDSVVSAVEPPYNFKMAIVSCTTVS